MSRYFFFHLLLQCILSSTCVIELYAAASVITIKGATANLEFKSIIDRYTSPLTQDDLRRLAIEITNLYHENGYTTSYAEKVFVKKNGDIEILVRESKITSVTVLGVNDDYKQKIIKLLNPRQDELYNAITIKERVEYAVKILKLSSIKINVINFENSADVMLEVEAFKSLIGSTQMKMQYEPIYGLSPLLCYNQQLDELTVSLSGSASIKNSEYRKKYLSSMISYSTGEVLSLYSKYEWKTSLETWKEEQNEFRTISNRPSLGMKFVMNRNMSLEASSIIDIIELENYRNSKKAFQDISLSLSGYYTDAPDIIVPGDDTEIRMTFSITKSNFIKENFISVGFIACTAYIPTTWLRIRPSLAGNYTSADERYYRWYVYDESFPVKIDDYASTRARTSAKLYFEFEIYPEMLYLGPIGYQTFFYDETSLDVQFQSAIGLHTRIVLGKFYINAMCLSTIENMYSKPVFLFSASGVF